MRISTRNVSTFKKYAEMWIQLPNDRAEKKHKKTICKTISEKLAYPVFGNQEISTIKRKDIKALFDNLNASMRQNSLILLRIPLNMIFKHALESEVIAVNPMVGITLSKAVKVKVTPLEPQEQVDPLEQAHVYREGMFYPHLLTLLRTGLRVGELCGLKWSDIDFQDRFIEVSRTRTSGIVSPTKNKLTRKVDMSKTGHRNFEGVETFKAETSTKDRDFIL